MVALAGWVLIVDEAHSYDPARAGMNRRWHAPKPFEPNLVLGLYSQFMLPFSIVGRLESGSVG
jgi:hypothetical protein